MHLGLCKSYKKNIGCQVRYNSAPSSCQVSDNLDTSQLQVAYNIDASLGDGYDLVVGFEIKILTSS